MKSKIVNDLLTLRPWKEKDLACLDFLVKFFTKSIHSGGVTEEKNNISEQST